MTQPSGNQSSLDPSSGVDTPKVSVVMPAYNHERYVGDAVESVLNQSYSNLELIVVDDGSTDNTAGIVRAYDDPRVRYHYQDNQDAYNALNHGLSLATGDLLSIINSDDVYATRRLQHLVACRQTHGAECIFTDLTVIDENGAAVADPEHPWNRWHQRNRDHYLKCGDLYAGFLHGNFMVTTSNLFFSRAVYTKVGQFRALRYLHDYDYIFRILLDFEARTLYLQDEKLLSYRLHGANTIGEAAVAGREQDQGVIRQYLLARFPAHTHAHLNTGIDRLIALEHELVGVRRELADVASAEVDAAKPSLARRVYRKLRGTLEHR